MFLVHRISTSKAHNIVSTIVYWEIRFVRFALFINGVCVTPSTNVIDRSFPGIASIWTFVLSACSSLRLGYRQNACAKIL